VVLKRNAREAASSQLVVRRSVMLVAPSWFTTAVTKRMLCE
jgi:hypothetical protein